MHSDGRQQEDVAEFFSCILTRLFNFFQCDTKTAKTEKGFCMVLTNGVARQTSPQFHNHFVMSSIPITLSKANFQSCIDDFFNDEYFEGYNCSVSDCKNNLLMKCKEIVSPGFGTKKVCL